MKIKPVNVPAFSQRAPIDIAVHIALTIFAMDPMLGRHAAQLKMPRPAGYPEGALPAKASQLRDPFGITVLAREGVEMWMNSNKLRSKEFLFASGS